MGSDESNSVVNADGRHHRFENLSVSDGSLFPTSLGREPAADDLRAGRATGESPGPELTGRQAPAIA